MTSFGTIHIYTPDGGETTFQLTQPEMTIGRGSQGDLALTDPLTSQRHARITLHSGGVWLTDLGSSNGTYLNGQRLPPHQPTPLAEGMEVQIGDSLLRFTEFPPMTKKLETNPFSSPRSQSRWLEALVVFLMFVAIGILVWGISLLQQACCTPAIPTVDLSATQSVSQTAATPLSVTEAVPPCPQPRLVGVALIGQSSAGGLSSSSAEPSGEPTVASSPSVFVTSSSVTAPSAAIPHPLPAIPFLEIPFPYEGGSETFGGTDEQFRRVMQRSAAGGRINSFFDHLYPLYPAPQQPSVTFGREPAIVPFGESLLLFNGLLSDNDYYSGHPAYDFSPLPPRQATTPVFAAAGGMVSEVGRHASGALYVRLVHILPEAGAFQTTYWHLAEDEQFAAMEGRVGETVSAGTRLGTMGNTGWSTGHHLHFEVRFDHNRDGLFVSDELVDPFGYIPNPAYPVDPWGQSVTFIDAQGESYTHTNSPSPYLWVHPLGLQVVIPAEGGHITDGGTGGEGMALCVPAGSMLAGSTIYAAWSPDPAYTHSLVGTGNGYVLSGLQADGTPIGAFNPPIRVEIPFDVAGMSHIDPATLLIYRLEMGDTFWQPLSTILDWEQGLAVAETDRMGYFALMGSPLRDMTPPQTTIDVSGQPGIDGVWYDSVTVTLSAEDPSGIGQIEYSLDAGTTWQPYTAPFVLQPDGVPERMPTAMEEDFGSGPGRFLVLAAARDSAGNLQNPPSFHTIIIDPSKNPNVVTTSTPIALPSITTTICLPIVVPNQNANVRRGPGTLYNIVADLRIGEIAPIIGRNNDSSWWRIELPETSASEFWIANSVVTLPCDVSSVPLVPTPIPPTFTPTPTPTPTSTTTPTPTPTPTPTSTPTATPTSPPDRIPPIVTVTHLPEEPTTGQTVTFTAVATDNFHVARIEIWVQGANDNVPVLVQSCLDAEICVATSGPYTTQDLVVYFAYGWDSAGNFAESGLNRFVVSPNPSP